MRLIEFDSTTQLYCQLGASKLLKYHFQQLFRGYKSTKSCFPMTGRVQRSKSQCQVRVLRCQRSNRPYIRQKNTFDRTTGWSEWTCIATIHYPSRMRANTRRAHQQQDTNLQDFQPVLNTPNSTVFNICANDIVVNAPQSSLNRSLNSACTGKGSDH